MSSRPGDGGNLRHRRGLQLQVSSAVSGILLLQFQNAANCVRRAHSCAGPLLSVLLLQFAGCLSCLSHSLLQGVRQRAGACVHAAGLAWLRTAERRAETGMDQPHCLRRTCALLITPPLLPSHMRLVWKACWTASANFRSERPGWCCR